MAVTKKTIGLFGGTFDPVHNGHVAVSQSYLDSGFIEELWIILTPDPPHKTGQPLSSYYLRRKMLEEAFNGMDHVQISDIEKTLPKPSYTVRTLRYLTRHFKRYNFYLCIGEDSLINFKKWHKWEEILEHCELLVADRPNSRLDRIDKRIVGRTHFIDHDPVEISSTKLREKLERGEDVSHLIPEGVNRLILQHNLYRDE